MGVLHVKIDRAAKTAVFSGDTFNAKEEIKGLGNAKWESSDRVWKVSDFQGSAEELCTIFPNAVIDEIEGSSDGSDSVSVEPAPKKLGSVARKIAVKKDTVRTDPAVPTSFSVAELTLKVKQVLAQAFPGTVYVRGVLSSVKQTKTGFVFMDLAEEERRDEILNCVIWRDAERITKPLQKAGFELEPDLQVMFEVKVSLSRKRGSVSLEVVNVVPEYTIAKLAAQREKTNERLREEGLFDRNRTLELPFLPKRLGILTSAGGTVINDFRNSLDQSEFGFELFWCSVSVQGAEAKTDILRGLHRLEALALDAILIFRGGGSAADLAVFNEYEVAKAVCLCKVPVISAIGHQEDQSSLQDVSYLAFGVPKDIGRFFADIVLEHRAEVDEIIQLLIRRTTELLQSQSDRVLQVTRHIHLQAASGLAGKEEFCKRMTIELPRLTERSVQDGVRALTSVAQPICLLSAQRCEYHLRRCEDVARSLRQASRVIWQRFVDRVDYLEKLVVGASPETQLKRGFTLIRRVKATSSKEEIVTMAAEIQSGEDIEVQFYDSVRKARVLE